MKKKVLLMVTKSNFGGAQRYVFDLATNLPKEKYEVVVASGGSGVLFDKLEKENVKVFSLNRLGRDINFLKDFLSIFSIISVIKKERPDIIHLNSPKIAGLGAFASRILNLFSHLFTPNSPLSTLIIYTSHGWAFNEKRNIFQKILIEFFSWLTIMLSHKTIVLTQLEFDQVKNWPLIKNKLEIIPIGIASGQYFPKEEALLKIEKIIGKNIDRKKTTIGSIGELHKNKGYEFAIPALANMENVEYIIISDGEEKTALENLIKELKATNIHLTGYIENAAALLKAFDVFLLPSIKEGLPYVLLEAGVSLVPIISTNVGGIPDLIKNNETGVLIEPKNIEAIKLAVRELLSKPETENAEQLKRTIETHFSLLPVLNKIDTLYGISS